MIDPVDGSACNTSFILSSRENTAQCVQDLAERERAPLDRIGLVSMNDGSSHGAFQVAVDSVKAWLEHTKFAAAVWTDLERNFEEHSTTAYSIETAVAHLQSLRGESLKEAKRYITLAPKETDTRLRRHLENLPWWQSIPLP